MLVTSMKNIGHKIIMIAIAAALLVPIVATSASATPMSSSQTESMGQEEMGDHPWNWTYGSMWHDDMQYMNGQVQSQEAMEQAMEMLQEGKRKGLFAALTYSDGMAIGGYISFQIDETTGTINDYTILTESEDITIFEGIEIQDFDVQDLRVQGSVFQVSNETIQVIVHDNPTGMFHAVSNDTGMTISFRVAEGIQISDGVPECLGCDDFESVLVYSDEFYGILYTDEGTITVDSDGDDNYINITTAKDHVIFRMKPVFSHNGMDDQIMQAMMKNRIAGEISLIVRDGCAVTNTMEYQNHFRIRAMEAEQNRIVLQVSSENHEGKVVIVNMDRETLRTQDREIEVRLDGLGVEPTDNPLEVLYASGAEMDDCRYMLVETEDSVQLLVYVPSFSTHLLSIESILPGEEIFGLPGVLAIVGAVSIVGVAAVFIRKK